jgi:SH3-like domain-containing protein
MEQPHKVQQIIRPRGSISRIRINNCLRTFLCILLKYIIGWIKQTEIWINGMKFG